MLGARPTARPFALCGSGSGASSLVRASAAALPPGAADGCSVCAAGSVNDGGRAERGFSCARCVEGEYAPLRGQAACAPCAPGTASGAPGAPLCDACAAGFEAPVAAAVTCTPCADNSFTPRPGTPACVACPAGSISGPAAAPLLSAHMYAVGAFDSALGDAVARRGCAPLPAPPAPPPPPLLPPPRGLSIGPAAFTAAVGAAMGGVLAAAVHWGARSPKAHKKLKLPLPALLARYERGAHAPDQGPAAGAVGLEAAALLLRSAADVLASDAATQGSAEAATAAAAAASADAGDAGELLAAALRLAPRCADANALAGALHAVRGEHVRAVARLRFAAAAGAGAPRRAIAAAAAAAAAAADHDYSGAQALAEEAIRRDPRLAVTWFNLGNLRMAQGDYEGALESYGTAVGREPRYYKAHFNAATCHAACARWTAAEACIRLALEARPLCGRGALVLGECLLRQGRLSEAADALQRAAVRLRRSPAPHVALGRCALRRGAERSAASHFLSALERDHRCTPALAGLALLELARGRPASAERHWALALRYRPAHAASLHGLASLWLAAGNLEDAVAAHDRLATRAQEADAQPGAAAGRGARRGGVLPRSARAKPVADAAVHALAAAMHRLGLLPGEAPTPPPGFAPPRSAPQRVADQAAAVVAAAAAAADGAAAARAPKASTTAAAQAESDVTRLVLISSEVGAARLLAAAALPGVLAVVYDAHACAGSTGDGAAAALRAARRALAARTAPGAPLPPLSSVALATPPGAPAACVRLAPGAPPAPLHPATAAPPEAEALWRGLAALVRPAGARPVTWHHSDDAALRGLPRPDAPQLHLLAAKAPPGPAAAAVEALRLRLAQAARSEVEAAAAATAPGAAPPPPPPPPVDVVASYDLFDPDTHSAAHRAAAAAAAAEAARAAAGATAARAALASRQGAVLEMYFDGAAMARWAAMPEALRPPPGDDDGFDGAAGGDGFASGPDASRAPKRKDVEGGGGGGAYLDYVKRRAAETDGEQTGLAQMQTQTPLPAASPAAPESWHDSASSLARSGSADGSPSSPDSSDSATSPLRRPSYDDAPPRRYTPAAPPPAVPAVPERPWAAVQLLIDLPWRQFGTPAVQAYFLRELADELDVPAARLRLAHYHRETGAVTVRILDDCAAHGDDDEMHPAMAASMSPEELAAAIQLKCATGSLVLDGGFGDVLFLRRFTAAQAAAEAEEAAMAVPAAARAPPRPSGTAAALAASPVRRAPQQLPASRSAASALARADTVAQHATPRRLLLLCTRAADWRELAAQAAPGVVVVPFNHEHGTLDALMRDVDAALWAAPPDGPDDDHAPPPAPPTVPGRPAPLPPLRCVASVGLLSHFKPGAAGLVRGARLSAAHVAGAPALRGALARLGAALAAGRHPASAMHVLHFPAPPGDAASAHLLRQTAALMGCAVAARHPAAPGPDALGDLYFRRGALRAWERAHHPLPFAPSRRGSRRNAASVAFSETEDDDATPRHGVWAAPEVAAAAAAARLAAVRAYAEAAAEAATAAPPQQARPQQQRVPLLVLDGLSASTQPFDEAPWSPAPMAPRLPALDADARIAEPYAARLPTRLAGGAEEGMRRAAAREATGIWNAPQRPPRNER